MKKKKILSGKLALLLITSLILTLGSCKKESPTVAVVQVVDANSNPVPNAEVRLFVTPTISPHGAIVIDDILYTDASGEAKFDFSDHYNLGSAGFAVLDIQVISPDQLAGQGIIKVEEERISTEVVIVE